MKSANQRLIAAAFFCLALVPAHAGILTFTDRATFLAGLSVYDETFQSLPGGTVSSPDVFASGGFGFTASAPSSLFVGNIGADQFLGINVGTDTFTFGSFVGNPNAVGGTFYFDTGSSVLAAGAAGTVTASNGVDPNSVLVVTAPSSTTGFFGFISTSGPITSLTYVRTTAPGSGFADTGEFIVGSTVPEPGTFTMIAAGFVSMLALFRRRRSQ